MTVASPHIYALITAISFIFLLISTYLGFVKNKESFFLSLLLFPWAYCLLAIFLPQNIQQMVLYSALFIGQIFFYWRLVKSKKSFNFSLPDLTTVEKVLFLGLILNSLGMLFSSTHIRGEPTIVDAMTYHLGAPKQWALHDNGPKINPFNFITLTASYFSYNFYAVFLMLKPLITYFKGLPTTQFEFLMYVFILTGQLASSLLGFVAIPLLLKKTFYRSLGLTHLLSLILFGISIKGLSWVWETAKNDVAAVFAFVLAYYFLRKVIEEGEGKKKDIFWAGLCLGWGLAIKVTNIYPLAFIGVHLFLWFLIEYRSQLFDWIRSLKIIVLGLGVLVGLGPFLLRNFVETSNPFFPTYVWIFKNIYSSDYMLLEQLRYSAPCDWSTAWEKFLLFFMESKGVILLLVLSLAFFKKTWHFALTLFLSLIVIAKITGPAFSWRHTGIYYIYLVHWMAIVLKSFDWRSTPFYKNLHLASMLLILIFSEVKVENLFKVPYRYYGQSVHQIMKKSFYRWDETLEENLGHFDDEKFISIHEYGSYFSRFPFYNTRESRETQRLLNSDKRP